MKHFKLGVLALALILIASCTTVSFQGMQMTKDVPSFNVVGEFGRTINKLPNNDERIFSIITDEVQKKGGDAAIDVTIEYRKGFLKGSLSLITLGLYDPGKIKISGTIIKYTN